MIFVEKYIVYLHKNKINNKVYIGQTSKTLEERAQKGFGYQKCPYFYHAIKEYGWNNFDHIILEENLTSDEADEKEKFWIDLFDSTNRKKGYNILKGGKKCQTQFNNNTRKKRVKCLETGEIFESVVAAAVWGGLKPGSACNISAQIQGKRPSAGKHPETQELLHWEYVDDLNKNAPIKQKRKGYSKKVKNLDTNEEFLSVKEAARIYHISDVTISKSCKSNGQIATGRNKKEKWHWIFI